MEMGKAGAEKLGARRREYWGGSGVWQGRAADWLRAGYVSILTQGENYFAE